MSAPVTLVGRLGRDPELRFGAQSGKAVAKFSVVTSRRQKNRTTQEWEDIETTWWDCVAFDSLAENCAESLAQGMGVVVVGRAVQKTWEDNGQKRSRMEFVVDSVGPDLRWATAKVSKTTRAGFQPDRSVQGGQQRPTAAGQDAWASSAPAQASTGGGWGVPQGGHDQDPPF